MILEGLGALEIRELDEHLLDALAAVDDDLGHLHGVGVHLAYIVGVETYQHVLYLVGHVVDAVGQLYDVLALNGRYERLGEHVYHLVLALVRRVLELVHLVQARGQGVRVEVVHDVLEQVRRLAGIVRALDEVVEEEFVLLLRHVSLPLYNYM